MNTRHTIGTWWAFIKYKRGISFSKRNTFGSSGDQNVTGSPSFDYLIVDKAAGSVTIPSSIFVNKVLTLTNGTIVATAAGIGVIVTDNIPAAVVRINGYIVGLLNRNVSGAASSTWNYPVGTLSGYSPVSTRKCQTLRATTRCCINTAKRSSCCAGT